MLSPSLFHIARLTFDLAFENIIQAAVVAHPSLFKPEDLDVRRSQTPSSHERPKFFTTDLHREEQGPSPDQ